MDRVAAREAVILSTSADAAGFCGVLAVDTFQPWLPSLGQAPFVWNLLAAIGEHTRGDVVAGMAVPGYRWHPAALAQAVATLAALHPDRVWVSLGPGEAIHEHVTGLPWPEPPERLNRMFESLELIRKLFAGSAAGKDVRFEGDHVSMESARLWTFPPEPPPMLVATGGPVTARRAGQVADGLMMIGADAKRATMLLQRFSEGAESAGRDPSQLKRVAYVNVSWATEQQLAVDQALARFPIAAMRFARGDLRSPHTIEQIAQLVRADDLDERLLISANPQRIVELVTALIHIGFEQVYLNNVGDHHEDFIQMCSEQVLPRVG